MPTFEYVAKTPAGKTEKGRTEAEDENVLRQRLQAQGFFPTEVTQVGEAATTKKKAATSSSQRRKPLISFGRVKLKDMSVFCRQFATMINAGVSLIRCLTVLEQQTSSYKLKEVIRDLQSHVQAGESLSKAMSRYPYVFSDLFMGLIRAGEVGGVLDETLLRLAGFLEDDMELRRKIKSAMTYPILVVVVASGIVIGLMTFILPKFIQLFLDLDMKESDFPTLTLALKNISDFMVEWLGRRWFITYPVLVVGWLLFQKWKRTKSGRRIWDWIRLKTPVFGQIGHKIAIGRFSRTLSTLLGAGVPILGALETTSGTVDNAIIQQTILNARTSIREGDVIARPLEESGWFPPMVVQMVAIGEETGTLDQMLEKIADFYEAEVQAMLESLTAILEPLLIVFLGVVVLLIVLAMFMPLITIISTLSQ